MDPNLLDELVNSLNFVTSGLYRLGKHEQATAENIEAHGQEMRDAAKTIAAGLRDVAEALRETNGGTITNDEDDRCL